MSVTLTLQGLIPENQTGFPSILVFFWAFKGQISATGGVGFNKETRLDVRNLKL